MSSLSPWSNFFIYLCKHCNKIKSSYDIALCYVSSRNSKLELELAQVRADFERLKSQDSTKTERLEELSYVSKWFFQSKKTKLSLKNVCLN